MRLRITWPGVLLTVAPLCALAQPWEFSEPISVTSTKGEKIFHHLESSGRRNIAISADTVAVAWEDDRDGTPRIYLARKNRNSQKFSSEVKISGRGDAFEPSLVALNNNQFAMAWEENAKIHLRLVTPDKLGPVITVGKGEAMQPSLASVNQHLYLVYALRDGRYTRIRMQRIKINGSALLVRQGCLVDAKPAKDDQLYPTIVKLTDRTIVAWEDRRPGHTIIMAAQSDFKKSCSFQPPQRINNRLRVGNFPYGKGAGAARVTLASYGATQALAVWEDKRNFREGYEVYSANFQPGDKQLFGPNIRVQDSFGGVAHQWHATVAGDAAGRVVAGWDDNRDGDSNIMLSWHENDGWSDDLAVPGADGKGEQSHPTIILDQEGNLHLAWIERTTINGPTQLHYLFGKVID